MIGMAVNKVVFNTADGEQVLIDLTKDTVKPETLLAGITAHDASGETIVGTMTGGGGGSEENQLDSMLNGTITEINSTVSSVISYGCRGRTNLLTVNLPNATSVGSYAFYGCNALQSVNLPKATSVPSSCFYQCTKLNRLDLGSAKSIGASSLAYCTALTVLILRRADAICTLNSSSFSGVTTYKGYIYVPSDLLETYKTATNWSTYASKFRAIEDYPDICES